MYVDKNWYFTGAVSIGSIGQYAWHSGNDGSGSGLDADLLDGINGASYLRSDTDDTYSGNLTVNGMIFKKIIVIPLVTLKFKDRAVMM